MEPLRTKLLQKQQVAEGTMAFHFEKPEGFRFRAGQSIDFTLINPPEMDAGGSTRTFSIASAPHENELMVATRMRPNSAFKRTLAGLPLGTELTIEGPMGSFTLHSNASKPAVFLAGGIGITPFLSMAKQAAHEHLPHRIHLFYSNHRPEVAAFLDTLTALEKANSHFRLIATMTEMDQSKMAWSGETGFIDPTMMRRYVEVPQEAIYFIAGPPEMVAAMQQMLVGASVDPDNLRTEEFAGY